MPKTVLYLHGLESGPQGRKARHLAAAGFTVVSELMPCSRAQILRDPPVIAVGIGALLIALGGLASGSWVGVAIAASTLGVSAPFIGSRIVRRVVRRSIDVQRKCLAAHPVDVVVGSSFGSAIGLELLARGDWTGPTVLLCPAHQLVARRARRTAPILPAEVAARIVIVHGRQDETVPVGDSERLVAGSRARLVLVDDDHRLSATATPDRLAEWVGMATHT